MCESLHQIQMLGLGDALDDALAKGDKVCFQHNSKSLFLNCINAQLGKKRRKEVTSLWKSMLQ